jgi:hypothetical protein
MMQLATLTTVWVVLLLASAATVAQSGGKYEGVVKTEWLRDGRRMKLLDDFAYVDPAGKRWKAKRNSTIDGASIPQAFWGTGGPYEGSYREASVVHDYYCDEAPKTATWQAVHRMFFDGMLASGVDRARALVMYGAVYRFGPRWADPSAPPACVTENGKTTCAPAAAPPPPRVATPADVRELEELVETGRVKTPEDIEALPVF